MTTGRLGFIALCTAGLVSVSLLGNGSQALPGANKAFIDGTGPGWRALGENDFAGVNGNADTWAWKDGVLISTGTPIGVLRTRQKFTNVEMVIKVLNACGLNSRYWVFAGGLTNVKAVITVTDSQTGKVATYVNPIDTTFQPIQDTSAFATCP